MVTLPLQQTPCRRWLWCATIWQQLEQAATCSHLLLSLTRPCVNAR